MGNATRFDTDVDKCFIKSGNLPRGTHMYKKAIVDALCAVFEEKVKSLRTSLESTREGARDAPGSNVSHSDTSKFQLSNVVLGLDGLIQELNQTIVVLRHMNVVHLDKVCVGALVTLRETTNGNTRIYFFVAHGGGEKVICDGEEISSIAMAAPLARACLNKKEGDEVVFNGKTYEVQSLQ